MEELNTENLQALLKGVNLNTYQLALANQEYKKLIVFAYESEKQVKKFNISAVGVPKSEQLVCDTCKGKGRKYAGLTLGYLSCPKCGL